MALTSTSTFANPFGNELGSTGHPLIRPLNRDTAAAIHSLGFNDAIEFPLSFNHQ
jgi:hypothetical protein